MGDIWFQAYEAVWEDLQEAMHILRALMDNTASDDHKNPPDQYFYFEDCTAHGNVYQRIEKLTDKYEPWEVLDRPVTGEFVRYDWPDLAPAVEHKSSRDGGS